MHNADKGASYRREFSSIDWVHEYDIDVEKRDIFLFGREEYVSTEEERDEPGIEWTIANRFIKNLRILEAMGGSTILVHMKSNGGDFAEGMAIYDAIKACTCEVVILNYTHARSMTSIIFQAASWRAMMPHSFFMYHYGDDTFEGTTRQFRTYAEWSKRMDEQMLDIYVDRMKEAEHWTGKSDQQIRNQLIREMQKKEDVFLTAEQAVEQGLADEVFGAGGKYDWAKLRTFV